MQRNSCSPSCHSPFVLSTPRHLRLTHLHHLPTIYVFFKLPFALPSLSPPRPSSSPLAYLHHLRPTSYIFLRLPLRACLSSPHNISILASRLLVIASHPTPTNVVFCVTWNIYIPLCLLEHLSHTTQSPCPYTIKNTLTTIPRASLMSDLLVPGLAGRQEPSRFDLNHALLPPVSDGLPAAAY